MNNYLKRTERELYKELTGLKEEYEAIKSKGLSLDMSRGKPCFEQLNLSNAMFDVLKSDSDFVTDNGVDCRNYGLLYGISDMKKLFGELMQVESKDVFIGGNSSLNLMFDVFSNMMTHGAGGYKPWIKQKIKFLCPVPGYDRHFSICEYYGVEMINIPMLNTGPDMDMVEALISKDELIKGIWCVPKYSNPTGITYSDKTVKRFAKLKPKAKDFRIMWDNAYCVHDLREKTDNLLNLMDECKKYGNEDMPIFFCSTSKITFSGSGVAAIAASPSNMSFLKKRYSVQTIGFDKLNQLRHTSYFKGIESIKKHMRKHRKIIEPKFKLVVSILERDLGNKDIAKWSNPNGGYFINIDVFKGTANKVVKLCKEAGVILTSAGATFPYGKDPEDSNIRLAPTNPSLEELNQAMILFCLTVKIAAIEKILKI